MIKMSRRKSAETVVSEVLQEGTNYPELGIYRGAISLECYAVGKKEPSTSETRYTFDDGKGYPMLTAEEVCKKLHLWVSAK